MENLFLLYISVVHDVLIASSFIIRWCNILYGSLYDLSDIWCVGLIYFPKNVVTPDEICNETSKVTFTLVIFK